MRGYSIYQSKKMQVSLEIKLVDIFFTPTCCLNMAKQLRKRAKYLVASIILHIFVSIKAINTMPKINKSKSVSSILKCNF